MQGILKRKMSLMEIDEPKLLVDRKPYMRWTTTKNHLILHCAKDGQKDSESWQSAIYLFWLWHAIGVDMVMVRKMRVKFGRILLKIIR